MGVLVHGFVGKADKASDGITVLFNSDSLRKHIGHAPSETALHVLHRQAVVRKLRQVDHAAAVLGGHDVLRIVIRILANDENDSAVVETNRAGIMPG